MWQATSAGRRSTRWARWQGLCAATPPTLPHTNSPSWQCPTKR